MKNDYPLRLHGLALAILLLVICTLDALMERYPPRLFPTGQVVPTWFEASNGLAALRASISAPNAVTIIGSSELNPAKAAIPTRYLAETQNLQVFAFGHAFNQSLSILAEVAAIASDIKSDSRLVILVSPGWFESKGTNTQAFAEFVPPLILSKVMFSDAVNEAVRLRFARYLAQNYDRFLKPNALIRYGAEYGSPNGCGSLDVWLKCVIDGGNAYFSYYLKGKISERVARLKLYSKQKFSFETFQSRPYPNEITEERWTSILNESIADEAKNSASNQFGVNDKYYNKYVKDSLPIKLDPPQPAGGEEMEDFQLLVNFLKSRPARVVFVLQSFNPIAYTQTGAYLPIRSKVEEVVTSAGFPFVDLMDVRYQSGTITDIMHMGDFGWQRLNHAIWRLFFHEDFVQMPSI